MPELPEVETIIRRLKGSGGAPSVLGQRIQSVEINWGKIIALPDPPQFKQNLVGKTIIDAKRRGKFMYFPLDLGHLFAHLRMSGDMRLEKKSKPVEPYDRVLLNFSANYRMVFSNIRKFGRMWYTNDPEDVIGKLGTEPLSEYFTPLHLYEKLQAHSRQIKPLLMDQTFIAGLGNVYTDEALFISGIHPLRPSDSLTRADAEHLHHAIQSVLREGIRSLGASIDWIYRGGQFQNYFKVYKREGMPCPRCGTSIVKIRVGQRGTHLCPRCQIFKP
ncbi:MAG: DNA-formamidopyrimidine glycosylase [Chloroflexota bacterium]|nr:DNA-formamidopyrimidine glycosylase [Chloroflexota bacterium]